MISRRHFLIAIVIAFAAGAGVVGLTLRPRSPGAASSANDHTLYYCPMNPSYRADRAGDCPICNMKLVPLSSAQTMSMASGIDGHATVTIDLEHRRLIGVRTSVVEAIRAGNDDGGGRLVEMSGAEYMVRGRGYARTVKDIEDIVVATGDGGVAVLVRHLGRVALGPDIRRGVGDLDGIGDTVGGIVVMRDKENALQVIEREKALAAIETWSAFDVETLHPVRMGMDGR